MTTPDAASLSNSFSPTPVSLTKLIGHWVNVDEDSLSTKRLDILPKPARPVPSFYDLLLRTHSPRGGGTAVHSNEPIGINLFCESVRWENTDVVTGLVYEDNVFAERVHTLKFISEGELIMETFVTFKDSSERRHYFTQGRFVKVSHVEDGDDESLHRTDALGQITNAETLDAQGSQHEPNEPNEPDEPDEPDEQEDVAKRLIGQPMPLHELTDLNGNTVSPDLLRGKPLLIDFFATWCGPCRAASPTLQKLHETYGPRGLVVLGASTGEGDDGTHSPEVRDKVLKYVQSHGLTYLVTYGNDAWSAACGIDGYPTFFFVNREGIVHEVVISYDETLAEYFEQVVQGLAG